MRREIMNRVAENRPVRVLIATPLEAEQVDRIRAFSPDRLEVLFAPDLLPVPRYAADHHGVKKQLDERGLRRWRELLHQADVAFDFDWLDPARLPEAAPGLRWVQATSAGIGEFLRAKGLIESRIQFTTAAGVHAKPLAEFVILGLLYFVREVPLLLQRKTERRWERFTSRSLEGMKIFIVGLGSVGRAVATTCARFGIEVWGMGRTTPKVAPEGLHKYVEPDRFKDALAEVDALVLACPLTRRTRNLIGREEIGLMRRGALLINIARGQVVDEPAMIAALADGRLGGAALDVAAVEPLPAESPLWTLGNVLISPHSASTVAAENGRIVDIFLDNLGRFLDGRPLRNLFDADRGY
jgi:phosphoglycerate dehydrogenase-like enzyme